MIVLDASVIAKWFIEESKSSEALWYRDTHSQKEDAIIVPNILLYELANLFRYRADFTEKEIVSALEALENFKIEVIHLTFKDAARASLFARQKDITVYDAAYLLVALDFCCKFITADKKLYEKTKALGFVKLL